MSGAVPLSLNNQDVYASFSGFLGSAPEVLTERAMLANVCKLFFEYFLWPAILATRSSVG